MPSFDELVRQELGASAGRLANAAPKNGSQIVDLEPIARKIAGRPGGWPARFIRARLKKLYQVGRIEAAIQIDIRDCRRQTVRHQRFEIGKLDGAVPVDIESERRLRRVDSRGQQIDIHGVESTVVIPVEF